MTLKKIDAGDLQVGMYVIMPTSWDEHPFLKNKFQLTSQAQIDKIIRFGLAQVLIDTEQSLPAALSSIERMEKYETPKPAESANKPEEPSKEEKNSAWQAISSGKPSVTVRCPHRKSHGSSGTRP